MSLNVRVITPDKIVWDAEAKELILPSSTGQIGILADHAPLLTALDIGVMRLKNEEKWVSIVVMEGFAEVSDNKVTILCNGAEEAASIDSTTAQADLEKLTLLVDEATTKKEKIEATLELRKAKARVLVQQIICNRAHMLVCTIRHELGLLCSCPLPHSQEPMAGCILQHIGHRVRSITALGVHHLQARISPRLTVQSCNSSNQTMNIQSCMSAHTTLHA